MIVHKFVITKFIQKELDHYSDTLLPNLYAYNNNKRIQIIIITNAIMLISWCVG